LNRPLESIDNLEWVARGKEMEPAASAAYEFLEEVQLATVGFITTDDGRAGASPDRLIPSCNAAVELKCPAPHTHLGYLVDGFETNYIVQAQAQIWIGRFDYVDRYSYHPEMPPALTRTKPDKHFQTLFDSEIPRFCDDLDALIEKARACGEFVPNAILA
jgi:hypothetical protein